MQNVTLNKVLKWMSISLLSAGIIIGFIGIITGGLNAVDFLFWQ